MQSYAQLKFVTEYFSSMQGLRLMPFWAFSAFVNATVLLRIDSLVIIVIGLVGVVVTFFLVQPLFDRYYRERFGTVESRISRAQAIMGGVLVACILLDLFAQPPINMTGVGIAAFTFYLAWGSRGLLPHYAVFGVVVLLVSLLSAGIEVDLRINIVMLVVSLLSLVSGLLDHLTLTRLMPPMQEEKHVESV